MSIATYGNAGCEELSSALRRDQYAKPPLVPRQAPLFAQYGNWMQYFDWQWARGVAFDDNRFPPSRLLFTLLFLALGALGLREHYRKDRASWLYLASLFGILSVGLVYYLNFKLGYSFPEQGIEKEVRERDYFFVVGFSVWGLISGIGLASLWKALSRRLGSLRMASPGAPAGAAAPVPQLPARESDGRLFRARLGVQSSHERGTLRAHLHERRQRHLPALVPAGGGGHPARRRGGGNVVPEHRLVREAVARPEPSLRSRRGPGRGPDAHSVPAPLHVRGSGGGVHRRSGRRAGRGTGAAGPARTHHAPDAIGGQHPAHRRRDRPGRGHRRGTRSPRIGRSPWARSPPRSRAAA